MLIALIGCAAPKVDFAEIQKPSKPPQMARFDVFVGTWNWEAQRIAEGEPVETWTGTAKWDWVLDGTYLHGEMSSTGPHQSFSSRGYWGWHPTRNRYQWWMFNDWGFPQEGSARYDEDRKTWTMDYVGVGLDGTTSYGRYTITVLDAETLAWTMTEWADWTRWFKKIEMTGTYKKR
jgi:hypothetical protein